MNTPTILNTYNVIASAPHPTFRDLRIVMVHQPDHHDCYVVATWSEACGTTWEHGHYFSDFTNAVGYYFDRTGQVAWEGAA